MAERLKFGDIRLDTICKERDLRGWEDNIEEVQVISRRDPFNSRINIFVLQVPGINKFVSLEKWWSREKGVRHLQASLLFSTWEDACGWVKRHRLWFTLCEEDEKEYRTWRERQRPPQTHFQVQLEGKKRRVRQLPLLFS